MKRIIIATLSIVLFASCSTLRVSGPRNGLVYDRKVPLAIAPYHDETENGAGELMYLLQSNGYNLISFESARTGRMPHHGKHSRPQRSRVNMDNSFYIMEIHNRKKKDAEDVYSSYRATISDSQTGLIIMYANLRGSKDARQTARELVRKMNMIFK